MAYDQNGVHNLYRKLLNFYPPGFREQLGESMEQTFQDLYTERQTRRGLSGFLFLIFLETGVGILHEHVLLLIQGNTMKNLASNPSSAAITSLILSLPLGLTFIAFMFEMEQLTKPLTAALTTNGYDLNSLGRVFLIGGLFLLPAAFVLNLRPMLKREGPEGKRTLYSANLIVGVILLLLITFTWGGLILEQIYCLQEIRCD
jgi:hypothetical protein